MTPSTDVALRWSPMVLACVAALLLAAGCEPYGTVRTKLKEQPFTLRVTAVNGAQTFTSTPDAGDLAEIYADLVYPADNSWPRHCRTVPLKVNIDGYGARTSEGTYHEPALSFAGEPSCFEPGGFIQGTFAELTPEQLQSVSVQISDGETTYEANVERLCAGGLYRKTPLPLTSADVVELEWRSPFPMTAADVSIFTPDGPFTDFVVDGNIVRINTHKQVDRFKTQVTLPLDNAPLVTKCTVPGGCDFSCSESVVRTGDATHPPQSFLDF